MTKYALLCLLGLMIAVTGCSAEQLKKNGSEIGRQYQCQQGNANRPDSTQRQIECQQQARNSQ